MNRAMPTSTVIATIPAGQSLSNAVNVAAATSLYIITPAQWTPANLTFQFSMDGTNFFDLFGGLNDVTEVMMGMSGRLGAISSLDVTNLPKNVGSLKLRSGSRDFPIAQEQDAQFSVVLSS
jgi:hypothetical protein